MYFYYDHVFRFVESFLIKTCSHVTQIHFVLLVARAPWKSYITFFHRLWGAMILNAIERQQKKLNRYIYLYDCHAHLLVKLFDRKHIGINPLVLSERTTSFVLLAWKLLAGSYDKLFLVLETMDWEIGASLLWHTWLKSWNITLLDHVLTLLRFNKERSHGIDFSPNRV